MDWLVLALLGCVLVVCTFYQLCVPWVAAAGVVLVDRLLHGIPETPGPRLTASICIVICTWLAAELVSGVNQEYGGAIDATQQLANVQVHGAPGERMRFVKLWALAAGACIPFPMPQVPVAGALLLAFWLGCEGQAERFGGGPSRAIPLSYRRRFLWAYVSRVIPLVVAAIWFLSDQTQPNSLIAIPLIVGAAIPSMIFPPKKKEEEFSGYLPVLNIQKIVLFTLVSWVTPGISASATSVQSLSKSSLACYELMIPAAFIEGWNVKVLVSGGSSSKTAFAEVLKQNYGPLVGSLGGLGNFVLYLCVLLTLGVISLWLLRTPTPVLKHPPRIWMLIALATQAVIAVGLVTCVMFVLAGLVGCLACRLFTPELEEEVRPMCFMIPIAVGSAVG